MHGLFGMLTVKLREKMQFREAINHLLTPYGGTRVKKVADLKNDHDYVAAYKNKLIQVDYDSIGTNDEKKNSRTIHTTWSKLRRDSQIFSKPLKHCKNFSRHYGKDINHAESHYHETKERKVIYIYGNGDPICAKKILLRGPLAKDNKETFQLILNFISERVGKTLASTRSAMAARRLYTLQGEKVTSASQVRNGQAYVVCGDQKLKRVPYGRAEEFQPAWKTGPKPPRTNDGRIIMYDEEPEEKITKTKIKHPNIKLPKLTKRKVNFSTKFKDALSRSNSPVPH